MGKAEELIDLYARLLAENRLLRECVAAVEADQAGTMPRWRVTEVCRKAKAAMAPVEEQG